MVYYLNPVSTSLDYVEIILNKCDNFIRLAGLVQLPQKTVSEITEFVLSEYAKFIISKYKVNIEVLKYARSFIKNTNIKDNSFIVPLRELSYFKNIDIELEKLLSKLLVVISQSKVNRGKFIPLRQAIEISFDEGKPFSIIHFDDNISHIKEAIQHELTHYIQYCINKMIAFKKEKEYYGEAGLPSKKYRNPELWYMQSSIESPLQDIEFYPWLRDIFMVLERTLNTRQIYKKNKEEICRAFVGLSNNLYENIFKDLPNYELLDKDKQKILNFAKNVETNPHSYFKFLQTTAPNKYNLAIKLLWKEMDKW